ncbi:MAG: dihydroorotate dehydrogenase-like protein [Acidimicrobiia bacterium]|nr:dihydroorotate dehydrogenase-like protein [Acidimicrobiia bacterium]
MKSAPDLNSSYLGLALSSPLVASAGPMTRGVKTLVELEEAGVGAVVLPSLFEEDVDRDISALHAVLEQGTQAFVEAQTYLPELPAFEVGAERSLRLVEEAKSALAIPVIASVNGNTTGGWTRYATQLVDAGADALELNVYIVAADPSGAPGDVRSRYVDLVGAVRESVQVPLAVKIGPYFDSTAQMAVALDDAGADGLVFFNRFYQPDIDTETLEVAPTLDLSTESDLRLPLRWIAILYGRIGCSLAASGVSTPVRVW